MSRTTEKNSMPSKTVLTSISLGSLSRTVKETTLSTIATTNTNTLNTHLILPNVAGEQTKSTSGKTIGLSIGLPVGIFTFALLAFLVYFYIRKNSILRATSPISPYFTSKEGDSNQDHGNWLMNKLYGKNFSEKRADNLIENTWPIGDGSPARIHYKISSKLPKHILTPQKAFVQRPFSSKSLSMEEEKADTFLYCKPPNIAHMGSKLEISKDKDDNTTFKSASKGKWKYESPLSSWFLRSSTYFRDQNGSTSTTNLSNSDNENIFPTKQLKHLKILSHVSKSYLSDAHLGKQVVEDESSPMLEKFNNRGFDLEMEGNKRNITPTSFDNPSSHSTEGEQRPNSAIYGTISSQTLTLPKRSKNESRNKGNPAIQIDPKIKSHSKRKKRRQSKLRKHLEYLSNLKPLPSIPHDTPENNQICKVIQRYDSKLTDEIDIHIGEYVKILATHTDGWCLVEKCSRDGDVFSLPDPSTFSKIELTKYLNENRGIVPGDCLMDF
ncbi:hypothetical protein NCAS_0B08790 [Naumovozyma castellii]|uniref:SH3 domain-containing protein n=1 Tax=Naumovozyma castellii TaxID=27288 RepID=G0VAT6_NAUCA|nr:hypothetical protein NCAS_0B08790 [Naumovozyma castellii CBS 4309]CCC68963.1 hypothetical protein NCAS_0B08790 [Naumovozyma castellii CBS 4309]